MGFLIFHVEDFDRSINWFELDRVDFSPVSINSVVKYNQFSLEIEGMILGRFRYMYIDISAILMLDFPSRD